MNWELFITVFKSQLRNILSYSFGIVFYMWLLIWIYPSFANAHALNTLLQQMPQGLMKVLGYTVGVTHVSDFLGGEFYSLLYLIIMAIYSIFSATKLISHLVENGSMAYLLATPVARTKIAFTQGVVLLAGNLIAGLFSTVGGLVGVHLFVHNSGLDAGYFARMNLVGALLFCVVSGYCFLFSCLARDERSALGLSTMLTIVFYGLHMLGDLSNRLDWMNHLSLFNVFNPQELVNGHGHFANDAIWLAVAAAFLFGLAIAGFRRRQLPL